MRPYWLTALAGLLAATGLWLSTVRDHVLWTGPHGSGAYDQPSTLALTASVILLALAAALAIGAVASVLALRRSL